MQKSEQEKEFEDLIATNARLLYKICHLYAPVQADRDDLYQEMVIQLWKGYPRFRGDSKFSTWLYRVALNTALTGLRQQKREPVLTSTALATEPIDESGNPEAEEQLQQLYQAIAKLDEIDRALVMLYMEDKSYAEMEEILGISQGTLRVKMTRIKTKLKEYTKNN